MYMKRALKEIWSVVDSVGSLKNGHQTADIAMHSLRKLSA